MRTTCLLVAAVTACLALSPLFAAGQSRKSKKEHKETAEQPTSTEYSQLKKLAQLGGTIADLNTGKKTLTLRVPVPILEENPNYRPPQLGGNQAALNLLRQMNGFALRYQRAMNNPNPVTQTQQVLQIARDMQRAQAQATQQAIRALSDPNSQPLRIVAKPKDFELTFDDEIVVRKMFVGTEYDDVGFLKEYTKEQLTEMRGKDRTKPGLAAKLEDVQIGQEVVLRFAKAGMSDDRPTVRMIVMTREMSSFSSK
jgi:hypothetical protein